MKYNLNTIVEVELTDTGFYAYRSYFTKLGLNPDLYAEKEIYDRKLKCELWRIMEIFGPHIHMSCHIPFKDNVITMVDK